MSQYILPSTSISDLPVEVLTQIILYLPNARDARFFATASKDLYYKLSTSNQLVWFAFYSRDQSQALRLEKPPLKFDLAIDYWSITGKILSGKQTGCFNCFFDETAFVSDIYIAGIYYRTYCTKCRSFRFWDISKFKQEWPEIIIPDNLKAILVPKSENTRASNRIFLEYNDAIYLIKDQIPPEERDQETRFLVMWKFYEKKNTLLSHRPTYSSSYSSLDKEPSPAMTIGDVCFTMVKTMAKIYKEKYTPLHMLKSPRDFLRTLQARILEECQAGASGPRSLRRAKVDPRNPLPRNTIASAKTVIDDMTESMSYGVPKVGIMKECETLMAWYFGHPGRKLKLSHLFNTRIVLWWIHRYVHETYAHRVFIDSDAPNCIFCIDEKRGIEFENLNYQRPEKLGEHIFDEHLERFREPWGLTLRPANELKGDMSYFPDPIFSSSDYVYEWDDF